MEAIATTKAHKDKRGDVALKTLYKKAETAADRKRRMAKIKKVVWLCLKIGIVIAILAAGYMYRKELIDLGKKLIEMIKK
jgi:hypothetical protein